MYNKVYKCQRSDFESNEEHMYIIICISGLCLSNTDLLTQTFSKQFVHHKIYIQITSLNDVALSTTRHLSSANTLLLTEFDCVNLLLSTVLPCDRVLCSVFLLYFSHFDDSLSKYQSFIVNKDNLAIICK